MSEKSNMQFKAKFRAHRTRWMAKVCSRQVMIKDSLEPRYSSFLSVYLPKLTPKYQKPCVMLHMANGNSSCLMRVKEPEVLIGHLQQLIDVLKSDEWDEKWFGLQDIADNLADNKLFLDEEYMDINEWVDTPISELCEAKKKQNDTISRVKVISTTQYQKKDLE